MTESTKTKRVSTSQKVIELLQSRKGFDGWWDDIDEDTQDDIVIDICEVIKYDVTSIIRDGVASATSHTRITDIENGYRNMRNFLAAISASNGMWQTAWHEAAKGLIAHADKVLGGDNAS